MHHFLPQTEADFVGSALVTESSGSSSGDDDKIYFFFTEKSQEQTTTYSHSRVARVARVCKVSAVGEKIVSNLQVLSEVLVDDSWGAVIDEGLDEGCICNEVPVWLDELTDDCVACVAQGERMDDCRGEIDYNTSSAVLNVNNLHFMLPRRASKSDLV